MKELIERLRDTASRGTSVWGDLQTEAADAIERLSQIFEQERNVSDTQALLIERLTAENAQLTSEMADQVPCINALRDKVVALTAEVNKLRTDAMEQTNTVMRLTAERDALAKDAGKPGCDESGGC